MRISETLVNYSDESAGKKLDCDSLIEAVHEYFDPTCDHDPDYLLQRIELLRDFFEIGKNSVDPNARVIDSLLYGVGMLNSLSLLPFDDALEVPSGFDSETHAEVHSMLSSKISGIKDDFWDIQHAYLSILIKKTIPKILINTSVTLAELIERGLPESDPGVDLMDF